MTIEMYTAACLTVIVIAIAVATVFLAMMLWQVRRAARAMETLSGRVSNQLNRWESLTGVLTSAASLATGRLGRGAALVWNVVNLFRNRRRGSNGSDESLREESMR